MSLFNASSGPREMTGSLVGFRQYFIRFSNRFPRLTKVAFTVRWAWWVTYGWPLFMTAVAVNVAIAGFTSLGWLLGFVPFGWIAATTWAAFKWSVRDRTNAVISAAVVAGVGVWAIKARHEAGDFPWVAMLWRAVTWFPIVLMFTFTWASVPVLAKAVMPTLLVAAWAADYLMAQVDGEWKLRRFVGEFRREYPHHYTDAAGRAKRIQSEVGGGVETVGTAAALSRPVLDHPALGRPNLDASLMEVEFPVARPEGRNLAALEEMLGQLAAQSFNIANDADAVRLVLPEGFSVDTASWGWLRVRFNVDESGGLNPFRRPMSLPATAPVSVG